MSRILIILIALLAAAGAVLWLQPARPPREAEPRSTDHAAPAAPAQLEGRIRGLPPGAAALILDEQRGPGHAIGRCDESGSFRFDGLAPGSYRIGAVSDGCATRAPVAVEIVAGVTSKIELELVPR